MSTGTDIILKALGRIGANSVFEPAPTDSIIEAMDELNDMLEEWNSDDIIVPFIQLAAPGEELGEPGDAKSAIINNLAVRVSPLFDNGQGVTVSPELKRQAKLGFARISKIYREITIPNKILSSTTPLGSGNTRTFRSRTFWKRDKARGS